MKLLEQSNDISFYQPFRFDGSVIHYVDDHMPNVELLSDGTLEIDSYGWSPVTGHSGQDRYDGPIMHESEQFSSNVLQAMYRKYGANAVYGLTIVNVEDGDYPDDIDIAGWIILKRDN